MKIEPPNANWGVLFHGVMNTMLPISLASGLHEGKAKPEWSQYVRFENDEMNYWHINSLSEDMTKIVIKTLIQSLPKDLFMRQKGYSIQLGFPEKIEKITYKQLIERVSFKSSIKRRYLITLISPTTFHQNDTYVTVPTVRLFFNSLEEKWKVATSETLNQNTEFASSWESHVRIVNKTSIQESHYSVHGYTINAFKGSFEIEIIGSDEICRGIDLLLNFGQFSGVGVKTAMGMGGFTFE